MKTIVVVLTLSLGNSLQLSRFLIDGTRVRPHGREVKIVSSLGPGVTVERQAFNDNSPSPRSTKSMPASARLFVFDKGRRVGIEPVTLRQERFFGVVDVETGTGKNLPRPDGKLLDIFANASSLTLLKSDVTKRAKGDLDLRLARTRFDESRRKWFSEKLIQTTPRVSPRWRSNLDRLVASLHAQRVYEASGRNPFNVTMFSPWSSDCLLVVDGKKAIIHYRSQDDNETSAQVGVLLESDKWKLRSLGYWQRVDRFQYADEMIFVLGLRLGQTEPSLSVYQTKTATKIWELPALEFGVDGKTSYTEYLRTHSEGYPRGNGASANDHLYRGSFTSGQLPSKRPAKFVKK